MGNLVPMEDKLKEAYNSFPKLHIKSFSEYYEKNYDNEKMQKIVCDESVRKTMKQEYNGKSKDGYLAFCNKAVDNVRECRYAENGDSYIESMKIEALYELNMLIEWVKNGSSTSTEQDTNENVKEEFEAARKQFIEYYDKYHTKEKMKKEFLECVFSLKYDREETCLDIVPLGKIKNNFWMQPIVSE